MTSQLLKERIDDFRLESLEILEGIESKIETISDQQQLDINLGPIIQRMHTLRGNSAVLGLVEFVRMSDALTRLLEGVQAGHGPVTRELIALCQRALAALKTLVVGIAIVDDFELLILSLLAAVPLKPVQKAEFEYRISFIPTQAAFRDGREPMFALKALAMMGEIIAISLNADQLPRLTLLDTKRCDLRWMIWFRTVETAQTILEVLGDWNSSEVEPIGNTFLTSDERPDSNEGMDEAKQWVEQGVIRTDQLAMARLCRQQCVWPLHLIALKTGKLTVRQVANTFNRMAERKESFRDAASNLGFLNERDFSELTKLQQDTQPSLRRVLVNMGLLAPEELISPKSSGTIDRQAHLPPSSRVVTATPDRINPPTLLRDSQEMLGDFIDEANQHLQSADNLLLKLEKTPTDSESLDALYRSFHTVKGLSGFFGLKDMNSLAHEAEELLGAAREKRMILTGAAADLAFASVDSLKRQVEYVQHWRNLGGTLQRDVGVTELVRKLRSLLKGDQPRSVERPRTEVPNRPVTPVAAPVAVQPIPTPQKSICSTPPKSIVIQTIPNSQEQSQSPVSATAPAATSPEPPASGKAPTLGRTEREAIRVDRERLDRLINMIGEMVIGASMVEQEIREHYPAAATNLQGMSQFNKIVRDLQELSLGLRMVPLTTTFQKMARIARDVGRKLNKEFEFVTVGEDTELDKSVVDHIGDPLMHMVRNSIDHGIESPEDREKSGKPRIGKVTLRAFHQGGNIYIELSDDGKGLNRQVILKKAIERGLVAEGAQLSDSEICGLIFEPGFSTAQVVTDVSGRGVGMDVVRRSVETLQGSISVRSEQGHGTVMAIRLPLTLAILDGLTIDLGGHTYVLPMLSVSESFRPHAEEVRTVAAGSEVVLVRGEVVPLLRLHKLFDVTPRITDPTQGLVVLVEDQGKRCGLLVDDLLGQAQVVIKNLETNFRKVDGVSGATILGDGSIALILDVYGLTRLAQNINSNDSYSVTRVLETCQ